MHEREHTSESTQETVHKRRRSAFWGYRRNRGRGGQRETESTRTRRRDKRAGGQQRARRAEEAGLGE
jgi:hypothetical protein